MHIDRVNWTQKMGSMKGKKMVANIGGHLAGAGLTVARGALALWAGLLLCLTTAMAQDASGVENWQLSFQQPQTEIMRDIIWFGNYTLILMVAIVILVTVLLGYCMIRFNAKANPTPSKTSHNTLIEVVWTVVPILILLIIAIPSFRLLYKQLDIPADAITVKATGLQWAWEYEYPDYEAISFPSYMLREDVDRQEKADAWQADISDYPRLLAVDYDLVVPVDTPIRVQVIGADVMHAFALPAFGVKIDAIPGRLNETWFKAEKEGMFYGQCSELCGTEHAFMPIGVRVVSKEQFATWIAKAADDVDDANLELAAALAGDEAKLAQR